MANNNRELSAQVSNANKGVSTPAAFERDIGLWFKSNRKRIATAAGSAEVASQMVVALIQSASRNPKIMQCNFTSIQTALMNCASTGLFPGPLQECAIVPYKGTATWIPMFGGLCKLAYNSGHVRSISANVVYEADDFEWKLGSKPFLDHLPYLGNRKERGERKCAYCVVETRHGMVIVVKSMDFIEGIRLRSPAGKSKMSPWASGNADDYDAMAVKTVLRHALKTIPKSNRLAEALERDNDSSVEVPETTFDVMTTMGNLTTPTVSQTTEDKTQAIDDDSGWGEEPPLESVAKGSQASTPEKTSK